MYKRQRYGIEVQMFDYLDAHANETERKEGYDIADYLLKVKPDEAILQQMIKRNPVLKTLIETFLIDTIGSDHAPHLLSEKEAPYLRCPSGLRCV